MATEEYSIGYEEGYQDGWNAALEPEPQTEKQEPVAWVCEGFGKEKHNIDYDQEDVDALPVGTMLYAAPLRKEWVGLTSEEVVACWARPDLFAIAHAIESKLKEKNGG